MRAAPALAVLTALAAAACGPAPRAERAPERIVLITIDTLRQDALDAARMPDVTAFAARGMRFTRTYAASSSTQPTHATLLTGRHPWQHGVVRNGLVLGEEHVTLAERLAAAGWSTAAVVASFPLEARFGFAQGFGAYDDDFTEVALAHWGGEAVRDGRFWTLGATVAERAIAALDDARGPRQFFWFHLFDAHEPYGDARAGEALPLQAVLDAYGAGDPRAPALLARARSLYADDVTALDAVLGRLLARLDRDEHVLTHVVFTADHGESFGEGGSLGHGKRLTPEQVLVPTFIVSPRAAPGVRDDVLGTADLAATVLALAGLPRDGIEGRDLLAPPPPAPTAVGMRRTFEAPFPEIRTDGHVTIHDRPVFFLASSAGLLTGRAGDVVHDDDAGRPASREQAAAAGALFASFADALAGADAADEALDPQTREALEALGYVR